MKVHEEVSEKIMIWIKLSFTSTKCEEVLLEYLG